MNQEIAWLDAFPDLKTRCDPMWYAIAARARETRFSANTLLFDCGDNCRNLLFLLEGSIRVYKTFENGRELVLYHLQAGECCSLSTSVLLSGGCYSATGLTESETHAVLIPKADFHEAFDRSADFRRYVGMQLGGRLDAMLMLLETVGTRNVEARLARWLLDHRSESDRVVASHRELASELGTAREVVSRYLKYFEKKGFVRLSRKSIELADVSALDRQVAAVR
jgi:CRP/FNR family transcriptional regulator